MSKTAISGRLRSQLFRGDPKLEAAAVSDPAHVLPGAAGSHVGKIQLALILLDAADTAPLTVPSSVPQRVASSRRVGVEVIPSFEAMLRRSLPPSQSRRSPLRRNTRPVATKRVMQAAVKILDKESSRHRLLRPMPDAFHLALPHRKTADRYPDRSTTRTRPPARCSPSISPHIADPPAYRTPPGNAGSDNLIEFISSPEWLDPTKIEMRSSASLLFRAASRVLRALKRAGSPMVRSNVEPTSVPLGSRSFPLRALSTYTRPIHARSLGESRLRR
jgi:hypothetical protein